MELDELKAAWAAHGAMLERSLAIDERLLRETMLRRVRVALAPYVVFRGLEIALGVALMFTIVHVFHEHLYEPRYMIVVGALGVLTFGITASCVTLLTSALELDNGGPVTQLQRNVERMKLLEYRSIKWALLGGFVLWLPALLVPFEALTGVAMLARLPFSYLVGHMLVGLVVLVAGLVWSKRYVERADRSPFARRVIDSLSGRGLQRASEHLAELAKFERDEPTSK